MGADTELLWHAGKVLGSLLNKWVMYGRAESPWWLLVNQHFEEAETK